jgi:uncharacterized protein
VRAPFASALTAILLAALTSQRAAAQRIALPALTDSALAPGMHALADAVAHAYHSSNRDSLLDVTFRLALVRADYAKATDALRDLRALRMSRWPAPQSVAFTLPFQILAAARMRQAGHHVDFTSAFAFAFDSTLLSLDDRTAALVLNALSISAASFNPPLRQALAAVRGRDSLSIAESVRLLRAYQILTSYEDMASLVTPLMSREDARRYIIERDVRIPVGGGATSCALIVRPRNVARLPALLEYTIYADTAGTFREARRAAANGYVGVTAFTRGKLCSDGPVVPYVHDGADAAAVIDWISKRSWSDGRVGMYSGSYEGFTQWAALKHHPPALKAILAAATNGPGIDTPAEGNIVWNFVYPWPFYTTDNKTLDNATYGDLARWNRLDSAWYSSGRAYRDLDKIDGTPNPIFDAWISHDSYDAYWQALIPYHEDFAHIDIPVLQTGGYYFGGPGAISYYFREHYKYDPAARHYLVIGPWDHIGGQRGVVDALGDTTSFLSGLEIDPVARLSLLTDLRYQWFDYVMKGRTKPALLRDRVNYEVVGANVWKHAPSIAAMANDSLRFYLSGDRIDGRYRLVSTKPASGTMIPLRVDLADRTDVNRIAPGGQLVDRDIDTANVLVFASDRLPSATELAGFFSGHLEFVTNKKDFDFSVSLYELTPSGEYRQLPPYQSRASHVSDLTIRHLLTPGERQQLDFSAIRLVAQQLHAGSRIVIVLGVVKNPGQEINFGSGKKVIDETVADAGAPLEIQWLTGSFLTLPVERKTPARR